MLKKENKVQRGRPRIYSDDDDGRKIQKEIQREAKIIFYNKNKQRIKLRNKLYMRNRRAKEREEKGITKENGKYKPRGSYKKK